MILATANTHYEKTHTGQKKGASNGFWQVSGGDSFSVKWKSTTFDTRLMWMEAGVAFCNPPDSS